MSLGVEKLLPCDCLNINEFRAIHINTHSEAHEYSLEQELLPKFHNFGGKYHFAIGFACLVYPRPPINLIHRINSILYHEEKGPVSYELDGP